MQKPPKDAIRIEELVNYFDYKYPQPTTEDPFSINTELSDCPWNSKAKLLHIGLQGKDVDFEKTPAMNLVFLIDVSGSMQAPNKLTLVKESLKMLIDKMLNYTHHRSLWRRCQSRALSSPSQPCRPLPCGTLC